MRYAFATGLLVLVVACGRAGDRGDTAVAQADTGMAAGMKGEGMGGMGAMMSPGMMDSMAVHMPMMDTASTAALQAMLPMHRQMAANLIAQMNSEMRAMNMTADSRWTALMDSVRADLVHMPDMNAQQLKSLMPSHQGRLTRLIQLHRDMLAGMQK